MRASVGALPSLIFSATAQPIPPAEYDIEVRYEGTQPTEPQRAAFDQAVARWQEVVLGDVSDELAQFPAAANGCYPALDEVIDDLIIYAELVTIDGAGDVLGSAGPCLIRDSGPTGVGHMRFDIADLASLEASGQLDEVVLHEMGHVLGFGSLWDDQLFPDLLVGRDPAIRFSAGQRRAQPGGSPQPISASAATSCRWRTPAAPVPATPTGASRSRATS